MGVGVLLSPCETLLHKGDQRAVTFWTDRPVGTGEFSRGSKVDRAQTVPAARAETGFLKMYLGGSGLGRVRAVSET